MPAPTIEGCPKGDKVSFLRYCETVEPLGLSGICKDIHGADWRSVPVERGFCQENAGDGYALYPEYDVKFGELQFDGWKPVLYWNLVDEDASKVFEKAVFLSGAFTMLEIPSIQHDYDTSKHLGIFREDLPLKLIDGIHELYGSCLTSGMGRCLEGGSANSLIRALRTAEEHLKPKANEDWDETLVRRFTGRLNQLRENYTYLEGKIKNRAKLAASTAPFKKDKPADSNSPAELKEEIGRYRQMVKLAIMQYYHEQGIALPSTETERRGVPTEFMKENPFGNGSLGPENDDSIYVDGVNVIILPHDDIPKKHKPKWGLRND
jgi:hypothetical protein